MTVIDQLPTLREVQHQWYQRLLDRGALYTDAVRRKKQLKAEYAEKYPDRATMLEMLASSALYADAKADLWEACEEIRTCNAMIQALELRICNLLTFNVK